MIPVARSEKLLIQEVGDELIVYDQETNASHCLNPMAARVWHYCDGQHTVKDIAKLLEKELDIAEDEDVDTRGLVWLTLEELERFGLIKEYVKQPIGASGISRRTVIKTGALVGGFAVGSMFPLVKSIVAPTPAMAGSPPPVPEDECDGVFLIPPGSASVSGSGDTEEDAKADYRRKAIKFCENFCTPKNCPPQKSCLAAETISTEPSCRTLGGTVICLILPKLLFDNV